MTGMGAIACSDACVGRRGYYVSMARHGSTPRLDDFLRARRARDRPEAHGITSGTRRTPGLRREELAMLAGVSTDYYVRLEQGRERHPSQQVLDALAGALLLEAEAAEYLRRLAADATPRRRLGGDSEAAAAGLVGLMNAAPRRRGTEAARQHTYHGTRRRPCHCVQSVIAPIKPLG